MNATRESIFRPARYAAICALGGIYAAIFVQTGLCNPSRALCKWVPYEVESSTLGVDVNFWQRTKLAVGIVAKSGGVPGGWFNLTGGGDGGEKLTEPYRKSTWVQRAIKLVAQPVGAVPLRVSTDARGGRQLLNDPELAAWWETPAVGADGRPMSACDFAEATVSWLKLSGNAFWILDDTVFAAKGKLPFPEAGLTFPRIIVARPDRMQPVVATADRALIAWRFTDGAGRQHLLNPMQVIHSRLFNPYDDHVGLAELDAASVAAESDYLAGMFKRNLWRANGDRGPYIIADQMMDEPQRKQLFAQLEEKRRLGALGQFRMAILGGGVKIEDPKTQMVDAAFVAARPEDRHEIFIAFGVPASMADVAASYSVGAASDWYRLIRDTCIPAGRKYTEAVEQVLKIQRPGPPLFAWLDWKEHPVMQEALRELITRATQMWDRGLSWQDIDDWLRLNLPDFPGKEKRYLPFSVTLADAPAADPAEDADYDEPPDVPADGETEIVQDMRRALQARRKVVAETVSAPAAFPGCGCGDVEHRARPAKESALAKHHLQARQPVIRRYESAFNRHLMAARQIVIGKLERAAVLEAKSSTRAAAVDFMFDLADWQRGLLASMRNVARTALQTAGTQFFAEVKKDDPFTMPPAAALKFIADRDNKMQDVSGETWERIRKALADGLKEGQSLGELAKNIRGEFNDISKGRAKVIAMTETSAAYGTARQEAMVQSGVPFKRWLTSGAGNVRASHQAMNNEVVPVNEPFIVVNALTGESDAVDGPGAAGGAPWNVINCHCVAIAVSNAEGEIV